MNSRSSRWLIVSALTIAASDASAQCNLPLTFDQKGIAAFKQEAASGNAAAQCGLGLMYVNGKGVPQDYA